MLLRLFIFNVLIGAEILNNSVLLHIFSQLSVTEMVYLLAISTPTTFGAFINQGFMVYKDEEDLEMLSGILHLLFLSVSSYRAK